MCRTGALAGAIALLSVSSVIGQRTLTGAYNVIWTAETNETNATYFRGSMPIGNGDTQASAWANVSAGGLSFYVAKQDAMHSDTSPYKVALVTVSVFPSPFLAGPYFNQTLDLATARVAVEAGGSEHDSAAVILSVWVDSLSNTIYATAVAGPGDPSRMFSVSVELTPVRPAGYTSYVPDWHCTAGRSAPDVVVSAVSVENRACRARHTG